mmetsp:Transcript_7563/g.14317  ORF Transcript_7563/g.14317 Transcript_7563/m.14317 type:complete len:190 (-) Transcript_7563:896-1465(-)
MSMRSSLSSDAVSNYVAHCLVQHFDRAQKYKKRRIELACRNSRDTLTLTFGVASSDLPLPPLSEFVASGASNHITLVVATVAKIYAQRLVKAARDVATRDGYHSDCALLPEHVLQAYETRVRQGKDPGFYMQHPSEKKSSFDNATLNRQFLEAKNQQAYFDHSASPITRHVTVTESDDEEAKTVELVSD